MALTNLTELHLSLSLCLFLCVFDFRAAHIGQ